MSGGSDLFLSSVQDVSLVSGAGGTPPGQGNVDVIADFDRSEGDELLLRRSVFSGMQGGNCRRSLFTGAVRPQMRMIGSTTTSAPATCGSTPMAAVGSDRCWWPTCGGLH